MNCAEAFYNTAKKFCSASCGNIIEKENAGRLMTFLMEIYSLGLSLPDTIPNNTGTKPFEPYPEQLRPNVEAKKDFYWEVFNPLECDGEPVCCSLQDDIGDICSDLQAGIVAYEQGQISDAIWTWKFGLDNHWGQHIVDTLRALHSIRCG